MTHSSLVTRLLVWFWLAGLGAFVVLGSIALWRDDTRLREAADAQSSASIEASLKPLSLAAWNLEYDQLPLYLRPLVQSGSIVSAEVRDASGRKVATMTRAGVPHVPVDGAEPQSIPLVAPATGERVADLLLWRSVSAIRAELMSNARQSLAFELIKLLLIGAGIYYLVNRLVLRRLRALAAQVEGLAPDDRVTRLHDVARDSRRADEITMLIAASNQLLDGRQALADAEDRRRRAEAESQAKSQFVSRMSHELRTPLNAILGFAQATDVDGAFADERYRRNLRRILRSGWHLSNLIGDLLDLSRVGAGSVNVVIGDVDLEQCWSECLDIVEQEAASAGVGLHCVIEPAAKMVMADPIRLRQVLVNLLTNAIKYNHPDGRVTLTARLAGSTQVEIAVADTGIGMTAQQLAGLFEPFNRLGRERSGTPGTGIGLVIAKGLTELMHGTMEVRSSDAAGTTVSCRLPRGEAAPAPASRPPPVAAPRAEAIVLYVEDDAVNREIMRALLAQIPEIRLVMAHTIHDGFLRARELRPAAALLDMHLPDGTGLDLLRSLRGQDWARDLPVAIVSADSQGDAVSQALREGASTYIAKPLDFRTALTQIGELVWPT